MSHLQKAWPSLTRSRTSILAALSAPSVSSSTLSHSWNLTFVCGVDLINAHLWHQKLQKGEDPSCFCPLLSAPRRTPPVKRCSIHFCFIQDNGFVNPNGAWAHVHKDGARAGGWAEECTDGRRCSVGSCQAGRWMGLGTKTPKSLSRPPQQAGLQHGG